MTNTLQLPTDYWFSNEHGNTVTVMATVGEWCMVNEEFKNKPYVLPLEFILAIYKEQIENQEINMYTQNEEEKFILGYFDGKFNPAEPFTLLSIGENDGKTFSNSLALIEKGWFAVLVEPSPEPMKKLLELHRGRPEGQQITMFEVALSDKDGDQEFFDSGTHLNAGDHGLLSTLKESELDRWKGTPNEFNKIIVKGMTWPTFIKSLPPDVDQQFKFISIDAEGVDLTILKQIDLKHTDMICIEWNGDQDVKKEVMEYCSSFGLEKLVYVSGENLLIAR